MCNERECYETCSRCDDYIWLEQENETLKEFVDFLKNHINALERIEDGRKDNL